MSIYIISVSSIKVMPLYFFPSAKGSICTQILTTSSITLNPHRPSKAGSRKNEPPKSPWNHGNSSSTTCIWSRPTPLQLYSRIHTLFKLSLYVNEISVDSFTHESAGEGSLIKEILDFLLLLTGLFSEEKVWQLFINHLLLPYMPFQDNNR